MTNNSDVNSETFVSVVAWIFIFLGAWGTYFALGQLVLLIGFFPDTFIGPEQTDSLRNIKLLGLIPFAISATMLWSGVGVSRRKAVALSVLVALLRILVLAGVALIIWLFLFVPAATPAPESASLEFRTMAEQFARLQVAMKVYFLITTVLACSVCLWVDRGLSAPSVREQFAT